MAGEIISSMQIHAKLSVQLLSVGSSAPLDWTDMEGDFIEH